MGTPTADPPPAPRRLRALLRTRTGRVLSRALLAAVGILAVSLVMRQARAATHRMPAYRIGPEAVRFVDLPGLVDARMRAHLEAWVPALWPRDPARRPSVFDAGLEPRLRELLGLHPMVRSITDLEVRFPSDVRVRAEVRTPLARVRARVAQNPDRTWGYAQVPVDAEGVVLDPAAYELFLGQYRAVLVTGVEAFCPPIGRRWTDTKEQVAEGLAAARVANRLNAELPSLALPRVEVVDVSGFPAAPRNRSRGEVVLGLSDGRRVQWGRTERDLSDVTREDGYETKRDRLLDLLDLRGPGDRRDLDVRFPVGSRLPDLRTGP